MKSFLIKSIYFLIPFIIIIIFLEISLENIPNEYKYKSQFLNNYSNSIKILILGSSHSFYGINPEHFPTNTFNASHNGQTLDYDYRIFKKYQKKLNNLKIIILPISYFSLYDKFEDNGALWRIKYYDMYYNFDKKQSLKSRIFIFNTNLRSSINKITTYYQSDKKPCCSYLGWGKAIKSKNSPNLEQTGKLAAKNHTHHNISSHNENRSFNDNTEKINEILSWSEEHNVLVLLFTPPAFTSYVKYLATDQLDKTIHTCEFFSSQYSNCYYINLLNDIHFTENDFYDADHLSVDGANKLSKIIANKIEWYIIKNENF